MLFKIFYEITSIPMVIVVLLAVSLFHGVGGGGAEEMYMCVVYFFKVISFSLEMSKR